MTQEPKIRFMDTTLRDGEQAVGVIFTRREKAQIAALLAEIGVDAVEAGFPALGPEEKDCVRAVVEAGIKVHKNGNPTQPLEVYAFARARREDVSDAAECGVHGVVISISTSDIHIERRFHRSRAWVLDQVAAAAEEARRHNLVFTVSAEDASRTDLAFLIEFYRHAGRLGAGMVRYCDSLGFDDPFSAFRRIRQIRQAISTPVEMHAHNDFGMATANVLAGLRAGATSVAASIGGLGGRAGHSPPGEGGGGVKYLHSQDPHLVTTRFRGVAE